MKKSLSILGSILVLAVTLSTNVSTNSVQAAVLSPDKLNGQTVIKTSPQIIAKMKANLQAEIANDGKVARLQSDIPLG
jgi:hypothetical protein